MKKTMLTLFLICYSTAFFAQDNFDGNSDNENGFSSFFKEIPKTLQTGEYTQLKKQFDTFVKETTFPLPPNKTQNKSFKIANEQGNKFAFFTPLVVIPLRSIRAMGLIALGGWLASKKLASSYYVSQNASLFEQADEKSLSLFEK